MEILELYNKSSETMQEVADDSVDVVFISPPYNIGTQYGANEDFTAEKKWFSLMESVIRESARVCKENGRVIVEAADTVQWNNRTLALAEYIQTGFCQQDFFVNERHSGYENSLDGRLQDNHGWANHTSFGNTHSNAVQLLTLSRDNNFQGGKILYFDYKPNDYHPCPTPKIILDEVVQPHLHPGMTCLEPFMGTGELGLLAREKGCSYIGYELDPTIFARTQERFNE